MREFGKIREILSYSRKAVEDYKMLQAGDKIAVGVSGGKDSLTLLCAMKNLQRVYDNKFNIVAITLDLGMPKGSISHIQKLCDEIEVELIVVPTDIYNVVFEIRKEKNPCSLCAKLRRGILHKAAVQASCNKVALGHHFDDAVETLMLNLFNEGRIGCFSPVTYLDRMDITLIRPFVYVTEEMITRFVNREQIIIPPRTCIADGHTDRSKMKKMLAEMEKSDKGIKKRIFRAMVKSEIAGFYQKSRKN